MSDNECDIKPHEKDNSNSSDYDKDNLDSTSIPDNGTNVPSALLKVRDNLM